MQVLAAQNSCESRDAAKRQSQGAAIVPTLRGAGDLVAEPGVAGVSVTFDAGPLPLLATINRQLKPAARS
jgi:hypothetical protein